VRLLSQQPDILFAQLHSTMKYLQYFLFSTVSPIENHKQQRQFAIDNDWH